MKVLVIGAGRLGTGLSEKLLVEGHSVNIIDTKESAFDNLEEHKGLTKIVGMGFDKKVLESSEIEHCDALVACTSSDETNALIARIAKNIYRVPNVIARLYDPNKAEIYSAFGIRTISTTTWGIQRASEAIQFSEIDALMSFGNNEVEIIKIDVPALLVGKQVDEITMIAESKVVCIVRHNKAFIPTNGTTFELYDTAYLSVAATSLDRVKNALGLK